MTKRYSIPVLIDDETKPLFPPSKNRSKRIHKKLVKRHGGAFAKKRVTMFVGETMLEKIKDMAS